MTSDSKKYLNDELQKVEAFISVLEDTVLVSVWLDFSMYTFSITVPHRKKSISVKTVLTTQLVVGNVLFKADETVHARCVCMKYEIQIF